MEREIERHLRWLMVLRVAAVSSLLLSVFILELVFTTGSSPVPFYFISLCTFALSFLYGVLFRWFRGSRLFLLFQLFGDVVVITGMVYVTGGAGSPFSFLYLIGVLAASALLYRWGALWIAGASWILYAGMAILTSSGWVPLAILAPETSTRLPAARVGYLLLVHLLGFLLTAVLASYVSEKLRLTRRELAYHQEKAEILRTYHENIIASIMSGLVTASEEGRVDFLNRGAEQILGASGKTFVGKDISEVFRKDEGFLPRLREGLGEQARLRYEEWFEKKTGERVFLGFSVSKLRDKVGRQIGFIFTFQDLTEMKALEEEVQMKQRMAAIGGISARMAHEIRNPLAAMSGSVQLLKRELPMNQEQDDLMRIILDESRRLDGIIKNFLNYARPARFQPQDLDLVILVRESMRLLENSEEFRTSHRLETRFHPTAIGAWGDPNCIRQVVWNLSRNALQAMPGGGTLIVGVERRGEDVKLFFEDDGIGMTEEEIDACFQPFQGRFTEGSGLGLSIVYRIVQEHSGRIRIQSRKGKGTRVEVILPAKREMPAAAEA